MTIKEEVKKLLIENKSLRDSDKKLIWAYWIIYDKAVDPDKKTLRLEKYMDTTPAESITRARRQVQEDNPELRGSEWVQEQRALKEMTKGGFINEEKKEVYNSKTGYPPEIQEIYKGFTYIKNGDIEDI